MTDDDSSTGWVPQSCTLPTAEQPLRVAEFDELFRFAVDDWTRTSATALDLVIASKAKASALDLSVREGRCCSFFTFEFDAMANGVRMRIGVPASNVDVLDALEARLSTLAPRVS